ncbi:hypothetical protein OROMI_009345 [Orobanche minor]
MEPKIYLLDAITPHTKNWTAKVSVVNKTEPRTSSQPTSIRFQKMLLADAKGNKIEAILYRGDIDLLKNSLQPRQTYLISNALVRPMKPCFENPLTNNKYQWILGSRTAILSTHEDSLILSELAPTFIRCDHFRDFLGSRTLISTAAIIIDSHPPRTVTARGKQNTLREYAMMDELLKPFIITFWNDTVPNDVYNLLDHISLSSTSASVILLDSKTERVQALQQWYFTHSLEIDDIQQQGDVFRRAQSSFSIDPETFTSIETFLATGQDRSFLCVRGKLLPQIQNLIYPCCTKCHRLTTAGYDCPFECHSCHETRTAIPRSLPSAMRAKKSCKCQQTLSWINIALLPTIDSINANLQQLQLKMKVHSKVFNKEDGTGILSHTIQSVECRQLSSSNIDTDEPPAALQTEVTRFSNTAAPEPPRAEASDLLLAGAKPFASAAKDHPRPDIHTATSSRGRALKTKNVD